VTRITGVIPEDVCLFMKISHSVLLRMRNVSDISCGENQYILCSVTFFLNYSLCEIMWKKWYSKTGNRRQYNMATAHCILDD
jgi:hypothetical protein